MAVKSATRKRKFDDWVDNGKLKPIAASVSVPVIDTDALQDQVLSTLADMFDPPEPELVPVEDEWHEPPDIVEWAETNFIDPVTNKLIRLQEHQKRLLRAILSMIWAFKVVTVVWSEIKKSGKTTLAGLIGAYWATFVEAPNEVITVANDQEQAQGRIYAAMMATLKRLAWDVPESKPLMKNHMTGSVVKAIGTNYAGEAGGNYGLTLWSELWAYTSEARRRLWEEMTVVPTRRYSVRWVETYAGFKNESDLLWDLYAEAFKDGEETQPLGEKIPGLEDLPVWYLPGSKMIVYWSHTPRMPWQTPEYYAGEQARNRPNAFARLHRNLWVSSIDVFISPQMWDLLERCETLDDGGDDRPLILGADGSTHGDCTALVAATWNAQRKAPDIVGVWVWYPLMIEGIEKPTVDLTETLGAQLTELLDNFNVVSVLYDPMQLHSVMTDLTKKYDRLGTKKLFTEFPQTGMRILSDNYLFQKIKDKTLQHNGSAVLREHMLNAVAQETPRGFRLDKDKTAAKIDAAVATGMAVYGSSVRIREKRRFAHV